jgi:hypothetical protein
MGTFWTAERKKNRYFDGFTRFEPPGYEKLVFGISCLSVCTHGCAPRYCLNGWPDFIRIRYSTMYPSYVDPRWIGTLWLQKLGPFKHGPPKQNWDFLENALNESDYISVLYGEQCIGGVFRKVTVHTHQGPNVHAARTCPSLYIQRPTCLPHNNRFRLQGQSVGRVNCCWPSPAHSILVSGPIGTYDQMFILSKTFTCFAMGPPLGREGGGVSDYYRSRPLYWERVMLYRSFGFHCCSAISTGLPSKNRLKFPT